MTTNTSQGFDIGSLVRAIEERDAAAQLSLYDEDAEVTLVDRLNPPGRPRVLRGRDQIRGWIEDVCARDMSHRVQQQLVDGDRAAFTEACNYPDGANVMCAAFVELHDGRIKRMTGVQAWDE
jgi:ketosteroid isomerase-like protein